MGSHFETKPKPEEQYRPDGYIAYCPPRIHLIVYPDKLATHVVCVVGIEALNRNTSLKDNYAAIFNGSSDREN